MFLYTRWKLYILNDVADLQITLLKQYTGNKIEMLMNIKMKCVIKIKCWWIWNVCLWETSSIFVFSLVDIHCFHVKIRFVSGLDTEAVFYPEMLFKLICFVDVYISWSMIKLLSGATKNTYHNFMLHVRHMSRSHGIIQLFKFMVMCKTAWVMQLHV